MNASGGETGGDHTVRHSRAEGMSFPRALLQIRLSTFENLALVLPMLVTCLLRASGTVWNNLPLY